MTLSRDPDTGSPSVDIVVQCTLWNAAQGIETVIRTALAAAAAAANDWSHEAEVSVALVDDAAIRTLNRDWRGLNKATNVLSFPSPTPPVPNDRPKLLGDVVIAYETSAAEAAAESKTFENHVSHLAIHGFLHLLGYGHEGEEEAEEMESLERTILASLGIPDPFST